MALAELSRRFEPQLNIIRRFLPALAFFLGFLWDSVTMGRMVSLFDLLVLTAYYCGAGLTLVLLVREIKPQWRTGFVFLVQFFYGGLFSALVVFYFKSAGSLYTFLAVVCLVILLIANEFLAEKYLNRTLSWTMFAACGTMYLNFLIPHLVHSVKAAWFYLSCLLSLALVYGIRRFAHAPQRRLLLPGGREVCYRSDLRQMAPATAVVVLLLIFYQLQLIPPVPLVMKESYICRDFSREGQIYQCRVEKQPWWRALGLGRDVVHFREGEKIYNLSAVFAPDQVLVDLEQRWWLLDETGKSWLARGVVSLPMVGGRQGGWRLYSYVQAALQPGRWKVETALQGGAVLGVHHFAVRPQGEPGPRTFLVQLQ